MQIRGVPVGSVLSVQPSLEQVNVLVEIKEPTTVIPRNSLIEANQSGLIAESLIDITPQLPTPDYKVSLGQGSSSVCSFSALCAQLKASCITVSGMLSSARCKPYRTWVHGVLACLCTQCYSFSVGSLLLCCSAEVVVHCDVTEDTLLG